MKRFENGFTLAETMIVIVVLGIIATLTIPALVNKNKESVAKTKLRKAMAAYESALNKMIIENDLKDNGPLNDWAGAVDNCGNPTQYFKKIQGDGCIFKTSDGLWWNISNIERPVISFKEITNSNKDTITTNANNENDKTAFVLVGRFGTDGSLRVDDLAYETANSIEDAHGNESKTQVEKLYSLLGMKKAGSGNTTPSPFAACKVLNAETCTVNRVTYTKYTLPETTVTVPKEKVGYMGFVSSLCVWEPETDTKTCEYTSTIQQGDYYLVDLDIPTDYFVQASDKTGSTCTSCSADYYNAAKRYCKNAGGELVNIGELKAAKDSSLINDGLYWVSEQISETNSLTINSNGMVDNPAKNYSNLKILCIGK